VTHFGLPDFATAVRSEMCDGFVVSGGVAGVLQQGALADAFHLPYFLQMIGTGLTTALCAHLAAVLPGARWPAVTCMHHYADDLLEGHLSSATAWCGSPTRRGWASFSMRRHSPGSPWSRRIACPGPGTS
jgi:L-alanine-DL-glutamate epimerase-like enolase superfamily enzyme